MNNYTITHCHSMYSLLDSVTDYRQYMNQAAEWGMNAIAITEHGNIWQWYKKLMYAKKLGLKYLHGVECYLTRTLRPEQKVRDNYHTILIAKNMAGLEELNEMVSISHDKDHFYYKPRLSFDEFCKLSPNIITTSACLAGPLANLDENDPWFERLLRRYDYLEVQPHVNSSDQMIYNAKLAELSKREHIPLISATDTHALNKYHFECRKVLMARKHIVYTNEDEFDLSMKSYDELVQMYHDQGVLTEDQIDEAIRSTNEVAYLCEELVPDCSIKNPILHGSEDEDKRVYYETVKKALEEKIADGTIPSDEIEAFRSGVEEENRVFKILGFEGFMLSMHELLKWCHTHNISTGPGRGSVAGSKVAYLLEITDVDSVRFKTIFSRFANENRVELGDIDVDVCPDQQQLVFEHIVKQFGKDKTCHIVTFNSCATIKSIIEEVVGGLAERWKMEHLHEKDIKTLISELKKINADKIIANTKENNKKAAEIKAQIAELKALDKQIEGDNPYSIPIMKRMKEAFEKDFESASKKYPDVAYYIDGFNGVVVSQGVHPAGMVIAPINVKRACGCFQKESDWISMLDMDELHDLKFLKYDILGLNTLQITRDAYKYIGRPMQKISEYDLLDPKVWDDAVKSPVGNFQFESDFAFQALRRMKPRSVENLAQLSAVLRPAAESFRDDFVDGHVNKNPSKIIDDLLKDNRGYIVFQEDISAFLMDICGFDGSKADSVRRAIGHKDQEAIDAAMPKILDGYCSKSDKPREVAEEEAKQFLEIIKNSGSYAFNKGHAVSYALNTFRCLYLRTYYPLEFITSYLTNSVTQEDIAKATDLAGQYGIRVIAPKFGLAQAGYSFDKELNVIVKGVASIKYCNKTMAQALYMVYHNTKNIKEMSFLDVVRLIEENVRIDTRKMQILIKIGFFSDYGEINELLTLYDIYTNVLDSGLAIQINRTGINKYVGMVIADHATGRKKDGSEAKSWTITDMSGLMHDLERVVKSAGITAVTFAQRAAWETEFIGYVTCYTGKKDDLRKVYIQKMTPIYGKYGDTKKPWNYRVETISVGSGKMAVIYCRADVYDTHYGFKEGSVIEVEPGGIVKDKKGYWNLRSYLSCH
ncbi:MAG: DNA polymerase III subunit alpha [Anaerolineaceae bacterium]|nr:DNA polymerase III subunit alpha [Anaerolineaceae bacterium]